MYISGLEGIQGFQGLPGERGMIGVPGKIGLFHNLKTKLIRVSCYS